MTTKLTLTMEKSVIERAKIYAKGTQRSLFEMVQNYLESLLNKEKEEELEPNLKAFFDKIPEPQKQLTEEEVELLKRENIDQKHIR